MNSMRFKNSEEKKILLKVWKWRAQSNRKKSIQTENNKDGIIKMSRAGEVYVTSLITECMNQSAEGIEVQAEGIEYIFLTKFRERDRHLATRDT